MQAGSRRALWQLGILLLLLYALLGAAVCTRAALRPPPEGAAAAYVRALLARDATAIYMLSDLLGPRLSGVIAGTGLEGDALRQLQAKDFARWKAEFDRGAEGDDSMRRELALLRPGARLEPVAPDDYEAEVADGEGDSLESYRDDPGQTYHRYFRLSYASAAEAPEVGVLENVRTGKERRLRAVTLRVEVRRRPELSGLTRFLLGFDELERVAFLVPFRGLFAADRPEQAWMTRLSFAVDKKTLETF